MPAMMVRETWTDERLDDLTKRVDDGFRELREEQRLLRTELKGEMVKQHDEAKVTTGELKGEMKELRVTIERLNSRFDALLLTLIPSFLALVLAQIFS